MLQRTEKWHLDRKGKFTASEIVSLCGKQEAFTDAVDEKVSEELMRDDVYLHHQLNTKISKSMQRGIDWEDEAKSRYSKLKGVAVLETGFIAYGSDAGGSPDGIIESENSIIEIKCPDSKNHIFFSRLSLGKQLLDDKKRNRGKKYYYQIQANMLFTGAAYCDFISFDPSLSDLLKLSILRCYPDAQVQGQIKESIEKATQMKYTTIKMIVSKAIKLKR